MLEPVPLQASFLCYGQYQFDGSKPRWTWPLQRLAQRVLARYGKEYAHRVDYVAMQRFVIRHHDIANEVLAARQAILRAYGRAHRLTVYMGRDKFDRFLSSGTVRTMERMGAVRIPVKSDLHLTGPAGTWTIYGMELVLVPWMTGMLVVPDIEDLRRPGP